MKNKPFTDRIWKAIALIFIGLSLGYSWRMYHERQAVEQAIAARQAYQEARQELTRSFIPREIINSVKAPRKHIAPKLELKSKKR